MKTTFIFKITLVFCLLTLVNTDTFGQNHTATRHGFKKKNYSPPWSRVELYYRRWLYFPDYNFYWDNYNKSFLYYKNKLWISAPTVPDTAAKLDLEKVAKFPLKVYEDTLNKIFLNNAVHKLEYKSKK